MTLQEWDERYRAGEKLFDKPSPLVVRFASGLAPGAALDVACGPGRNALYLAQRGWRVTAVDGSQVAIEILRERARQRKLEVDACVGDLERHEFEIRADVYDLICCCYYFQRDLFPQIRSGVRPHGLVIAIVHLPSPAEPQEKPRRARPGELRSYFEDWEILHYYEGASNEPEHHRPVAEMVAKRRAETA